jgi:hypothetical protein
MGVNDKFSLHQRKTEEIHISTKNMEKKNQDVRTLDDKIST